MNSEDNTPLDNKGASSWFTAKVYETEDEKKKDRWIGVGLFFVLNILLFLCRWGVGVGMVGLYSQTNTDLADSLTNTIWIILYLLPWVINIGLMIYFAFTRSQIALGMLIGFGIALAIVVVLGLVFVVGCFVILALYGANL